VKVTIDTVRRTDFPSIFWLITVPVFGYVLLRAWQMSFFIDESFSFTHFVLDSYRAIITYRIPDANNHVINSICMKLCSSLFGNGELSLRLANVMSFPVYAAFAWLLLDDIEDKIVRVRAYLMLILNPFLLDFFSVARGYGMSEAMMMASLYYLVQLLRQQLYYLVPSILFFFFGMLAVLCNFTLLNWFLLSIVLAGARMIYLVVMRRHQWKMYTTAFFAGMVLLVPPAGYVGVIIVKLYKAGVLGYGGDEDFWQDTVNSLVKGMLYGQSYSYFMEGVMQVSVIGALLVALLIFSYWFRKRRQFFQKYGLLWICFSLLGGLFGVIELQHYLFGSPYVIQRTALFFVPLFTLLIIQLLYVLASRALWGKYITMALALLTLVHFAFSANLKYVYIWKFDADTKQAMSDLEKIHEKETANIVLQPYWQQVSTADFYRYTKNCTWLQPVKSLGRASQMSFAEDYYYWPKDSLYLFKAHPLQIVKEYPLSGMLLLRNLQKLKHDTLAFQKITFGDTVLPAHGFSQAIGMDIRALSKDTSLNIITKTRLKFLKTWKQGQLVIVISGKKGEQLYWQSYRFRDYLFRKCNEMEIPFETALPKLTASMDSLKVLIWNADEGAMIIKNLSAAVERR
jgi:hypothetical protein